MQLLWLTSHGYVRLIIRLRMVVSTSLAKATGVVPFLGLSDLTRAIAIGPASFLEPVLLLSLGGGDGGSGLGRGGGSFGLGDAAATGGLGPRFRFFSRSADTTPVPRGDDGMPTARCTAATAEYGPPSATTIDTERLRSKPRTMSATLFHRGSTGAGFVASAAGGAAEGAAAAGEAAPLGAFAGDLLRDCGDASFLAFGLGGVVRRALAGDFVARLDGDGIAL